MTHFWGVHKQTPTVESEGATPQKHVGPVFIYAQLKIGLSLNN